MGAPQETNPRRRGRPLKLISRRGRPSAKALRSFHFNLQSAEYRHVLRHVLQHGITVTEYFRRLVVEDILSAPRETSQLTRKG